MNLENFTPQLEVLALGVGAIQFLEVPKGYQASNLKLEGFITLPYGTLNSIDSKIPGGKQAYRDRLKTEGWDFSQCNNPHVFILMPIK